jgi:hypothetical protein
MLPRCSPEEIRDEDDRNFADSSELPQRGMAKIHRLRPPSLDSSLLEVLCVEADLRSITGASDGLNRQRWILAGARVSVYVQNSGKRRTIASRVLPWRRFIFYRRRRVAAFISHVQQSAVDRMPRRAPSSCFFLRKTKARRGIWAGLRSWGVGPA